MSTIKKNDANGLKKTETNEVKKLKARIAELEEEIKLMVEIGEKTAETEEKEEPKKKWANLTEGELVEAATKKFNEVNL